jgi:hypothetical protein
MWMTTHQQGLDAVSPLLLRVARDPEEARRRTSPLAHGSERGGAVRARVAVLIVQSSAWRAGIFWACQGPRHPTPSDPPLTGMRRAHDWEE